MKQWCTEERVRGFEPLPLAYDLRNKRVRKRQNRVFTTKNTKNLLGKGHSLLHRLPMGREYPLPTPHPLLSPLGACGTSHLISSHLSLIKQIDKTQPYNRAKQVNVFKEHSVDIVSIISLDS